MASAKDWRFQTRALVALLVASLLSSSCQPMSLVEGPLQFSQGDYENTARVCYKPTVRELARDIDFLDRHIETYGSVVTKQPDVWGQARLTIYRNEYEQLMAQELGNFQPSLQGSVSGSDQAYFADAFALGAAASGSAATIQRPAARSSGSAATSSTTSTTIIPGSATTPAETTGAAASSPPTPQTIPIPTPPSPTGTFDAFNASNFTRTKAYMPTPIGFANPKGGLTVEPTVYLDQKSVYLNHLQELRRISEGDDTADSPGYALNLVRFPVSVLPGKRTDIGYGAEITMTMRPYLNEELLPTTFRNLVLNDLVDQIAFPATQFINNPSNNPYLNPAAADDLNHLFNFLELYSLKDMTESPHLEKLKELRWKVSLQEVFKRPEWMWVDRLLQVVESSPRDVKDRRAWKQENTQRLYQIQHEASNLRFQLHGMSLVPATKSRRARLPFPPSQMLDVYGYDFAYHLVADPYAAMSGERYAHPSPESTQVYIHLPDVQAYFQEEISAAQKLLQDPNGQILWQFCAPERGLEAAIRTHNTEKIWTIRDQFKSVIDAIQSHGAAETDPSFRHSTVAALTWGVIVESALLNGQLVRDMHESAALKGCPLISIPEEKQDFYKPDPSPEARQAFNQYVQCRWPMHVFALDPAAWQQNLASTFSMRREMQLALSMAFVTGRISANNMMQFARRVEFDFATIDLNGTAVGFSHGDETFGWRFYPRFQTPDVDCNLTVLFRDQLRGGPNKNDLLKERRLEPGIRECYAVVIMPSFVPYATLNVSTNWFSLVNPRKKELDTEYAVKLSNRVKQIENCVPCIADGQCYRDEEVERLREKVNQLATRLPLQSTKVQIPYENTLGGFGMFNTGVTDLAPELVGWYGTSSINPNAPTTLFLAGDHFSVHQTTVIAGGQWVQAQLLSRQVVQITIPPGPLLVGDPEQKFVDVQLATPYGVTQHLLIPACTPPKTDANGTGIGWSATTLQISPTGAATAVPGAPAATTPDTASPSKTSDAASTAPTSDGAGKAKTTDGENPSKSSGASNPATAPSAPSKSTGTAAQAQASGTAPATPSTTKPAALVIQPGDVDTSKYDLVDVTLKFDPKYGVSPITISGAAYDSTLGGYAVPTATLASQLLVAFSRYFGPLSASLPSALSTTTILTFRSSAHLYADFAKTTSSSLTIQWIKAAAASVGGSKPGS